jgi:hypothetical protein
MSIKTKAPEIQEDPATKKLREQAEARADATRFGEAQEFTSDATQRVVRRFGARAAEAGASGTAAYNPFASGTGGSGTSFTGFTPGNIGGQPSNVAAPQVFRRASSGGRQGLGTVVQRF